MASARGRSALGQGAAAEHAADERARAIFETGRQAFEQARYQEAIEAFERVFAMTGHPMMLINIGNAWAKLAQRERAIGAYRQYLQLQPDDPDANELRLRIQELEAELSAQAPTTPEVPETPQPHDDGWLLGRTWTWVAAGASVAAAGAAAYLWTGAESRYDALRDSCAVSGCSGRQIDAVDGRVTATNVALGVSVVGLLSAGALWFYEAPERDQSAPGLQLDIQVGGATLRGRF